MGGTTETYQEISESLLNEMIETGARLTIYLEPDVSVKTRKGQGPYQENYQLPNLIVEQGHFIAMTDGNHLSSIEEARHGLRSYYSYSNISDAFIHHLAGLPDGDQVNSVTQFMSLSRYRCHLWLLTRDQRLLWDGHTEPPTKEIVDAIKSGKRFRLALQNEGGIWRIHPVDLPFYLQDEDCFRFQTQIHWHPSLFEQPAFMSQYFENNNYPGTDSSHAAEFSYQQTLPSSSSYLSVYSDGRYQLLDELETKTYRRYKNIRLFCDD